MGRLRSVTTTSAPCSTARRYSERASFSSAILTVFMAISSHVPFVKSSWCSKQQGKVIETGVHRSGEPSTSKLPVTTARLTSEFSRKNRHEFATNALEKAPRNLSRHPRPNSSQIAARLGYRCFGHSLGNHLPVGKAPTLQVTTAPIGSNGSMSTERSFKISRLSNDFALQPRPIRQRKHRARCQNSSGSTIEVSVANHSLSEQVLEVRQSRRMQALVGLRRGLRSQVR